MPLGWSVAAWTQVAHETMPPLLWGSCCCRGLSPRTGKLLGGALCSADISGSQRLLRIKHRIFVHPSPMVMGPAGKLVGEESTVLENHQGLFSRVML